MEAQEARLHRGDDLVKIVSLISGLEEIDRIELKDGSMNVVVMEDYNTDDYKFVEYPGITNISFK